MKLIVSYLFTFLVFGIKAQDTTLIYKVCKGSDLYLDHYCNYAVCNPAPITWKKNGVIFQNQFSSSRLTVRNIQENVEYTRIDPNCPKTTTLFKIQLVQIDSAKFFEFSVVNYPYGVDRWTNFNGRTPSGRNNTQQIWVSAKKSNSSDYFSSELYSDSAIDFSYFKNIKSNPLIISPDIYSGKKLDFSFLYPIETNAERNNPKIASIHIQCKETIIKNGVNEVKLNISAYNKAFVPIRFVIVNQKDTSAGGSNWNTTFDPASIPIIMNYLNDSFYNQAVIQLEYRGLDTFTANVDLDKDKRFKIATEYITARNKFTSDTNLYKDSIYYFLLIDSFKEFDPAGFALNNTNVVFVNNISLKKTIIKLGLPQGNFYNAYGIFAHELGHCFGLVHAGNEDIMIDTSICGAKNSNIAKSYADNLNIMDYCTRCIDYNITNCIPNIPTRYFRKFQWDIFHEKILTDHKYYYK